MMPSLADVEIQLQGNGPWSLGQDFDIIHTPGHTEGSICLWYKPLKVLFTGDHLARGGAGEPPVPSIFEKYNWFSGHGRRIEFKDIQDKNSALEVLLASKEQADGTTVQNKELAAYAP